MKEKCNKYFMIIVISILSILCVGTLVSSAKTIGAFLIKTFPGQVSDMHYDEAASSFTKTMEDDVQNNVFADSYFIDVYGLTQLALGRNMIYGDNICKDNNGFLQGMYERLDVSPYAEKISELDKWLKDKGIDFCYIQAPSKIIPGYTECPEEFINYTNENAADLTELLNKENVDCFDVKELLNDSGYPLDKAFYRTDHHWTTNFCFYTYTKAMSEINEKYSLGIDERVYDADSFSVKTYKKSFLGSTGVVTSKFFAGLDDYSVITPDFDTSLELTHFDGDTVKEQRSGSFEEVVLYPYYKKEKLHDYSTRSYDTYLKTIYTEKVIKNNNGNGKKLLILSDSYGMPFSAFASLGFSETHIIDCRYGEIENGIYSYLEEYQPDIVIMLLSTTTYKQIEWDNFAQN